ncbi:MAG: hypothetical protein ABIH99_03955 [Candidatus Micrarchaeota archaeon]
MSIKDKAAVWYIKNILLPKIEEIDKPGFVVSRASQRGKETYLRILFLPELLLMNIENEVAKKYGDEGKKLLYATGKKFGYVYASVSNFPTLKSASEKEVMEFTYFFTKLLGVTYAENADFKRETGKTVSFVADNYLVCRKNGIGHILADGGGAGFWAYAMADKKVEGVQTECVGRKGKRCVVVCGPLEELRKRGLEPYSSQNLEEVEAGAKYKALNEVKKTVYAKNSLRRLLDMKFFTQTEAGIDFKGERHFLCESHLVYIIENEVERKKGGEELLFRASFKAGEEIGKLSGDKNAAGFVNDYLPALGWGDIVLTKRADKYCVDALYFPWTTYAEKSRFTIFRGLASGMVSALLGKRLNFMLASTEMTLGALTLHLKEE